MRVKLAHVFLALAAVGITSIPAAAQSITASCSEDMPVMSLTANTGPVGFENVQMTKALQQRISELEAYHVSLTQLSCIEKTSASTFHLSLTPRIEYNYDKLIEFEYYGSRIRAPATPADQVKIETVRIIFVGNRPLAWAPYAQTKDGAFQGETKLYHFPIDWGFPALEHIDISGDPDWFKGHTTLNLPSLKSDE